MSYQLETAIDGIPSGVESVGPFAALIASDALPYLLRECLRDPETRARVLSASYAHPNGFLKIVLPVSTTTGYRLVLHAWMDNTNVDPARNGHVHDHRWDFTSHVLIGEIHYEQYMVSDGNVGQEFAVADYRSPGATTAYRLSDAGQIRVRSESAGVLAAGSTYWLHRDVLHRAWVAGHSSAATLVIQHSVMKAGTRVLRANRLEAVVEPTVRRLLNVELERAISAVLAVY